MHNLLLGNLRHHCIKVFNLKDVGDKLDQHQQQQQRRQQQKQKTTLIAHTPDEQQAILDRIVTLIEARSEGSLKNMRKDYLTAVALHNGIFDVGVDLTTLTKRDLSQALIQWTLADGTTISIPPPRSTPTTHFCLDDEEERLKYSVFTEDVLKQVREDITSIQLPTWMEKPPSNFGSAAHGKLKADAWRTVCSVHLIITLVRLWGSSTSTPAERAVLENFVQLIVAVDVATRRAMSDSRAALYDECMESYLGGLLALFKHPLVPNHHLSLHLRQCLELFGPVHGWWAYPFERYNGLLQRMNTNYHTAEMPKTFIRHFYIGGRLRWLMRSLKWPTSPVYTEFLDAYSNAFGDVMQRSHEGGSRPSSPEDHHVYDPRKAKALPPDVYRQLHSLISSGSAVAFKQARAPSVDGRPRLPDDAEFVNSIVHDGLRYSTDRYSERDSHILFRNQGGEFDGASDAAKIVTIFYHHRREGDRSVTEPFLVVRRYRPLAPHHEQFDPYRPFPNLRTISYYDELEAQLHVIRPCDIVSHFASHSYVPQGIQAPCIVVRSLDRV
ncbi:hypothetical protein FKP32DRAFT_1560994 [Trametes sanguinea]|nr:hypothetical protein FKP32DRAFT_1560994 [Trametes sanguinea]